MLGNPLIEVFQDGEFVATVNFRKGEITVTSKLNLEATVDNEAQPFKVTVKIL